eukprot:2687436-Prymnesium_polylepis.3
MCCDLGGRLAGDQGHSSCALGWSRGDNREKGRVAVLAAGPHEQSCPQVGLRSPVSCVSGINYAYAYLHGILHVGKHAPVFLVMLAYYSVYGTCGVDHITSRNSEPSVQSQSSPPARRRLPAAP